VFRYVWGSGESPRERVLATRAFRVDVTTLFHSEIEFEFLFSDLNLRYGARICPPARPPARTHARTHALAR
jgi:hypothetical protein